MRIRFGLMHLIWLDRGPSNVDDVAFDRGNTTMRFEMHAFSVGFLTLISSFKPFHFIGTQTGRWFWFDNIQFYLDGKKRREGNNYELMKFSHNNFLAFDCVMAARNATPNGGAAHLHFHFVLKNHLADDRNNT